MSGVTITIDMTVKPEFAEAVIAGIPLLIEDTPNFAGFRAIRVVRHSSQANRVLIVEQWDGLDDYQAYQAWRNRDGQMEAAYARLEKIETEVWPGEIGYAAASS